MTIKTSAFLLIFSIASLLAANVIRAEDVVPQPKANNATSTTANQVVEGQTHLYYFNSPASGGVSIVSSNGTGVAAASSGNGGVAVTMSSRNAPAAVYLYQPPTSPVAEFHRLDEEAHQEFRAWYENMLRRAYLSALGFDVQF